MRLSVNFDALERVASIFRSDRKFDFEAAADIPWEPIDIALQSGIEIRPEELEIIDGLLSYKGRHVILYIRDHGRGIADALTDPKSGRKFHLADCVTLEQMRSEGRFARYVVTRAVTGDFEIAGVDPVTRKEVTGSARLQVCINCLKHLNYRSALIGSQSQRREARDDFQLAEFFETYSTRFKYLPQGLAAKSGASVYSGDWPELSQRLRANANYGCEECGVCLEEKKSLLHVHHINGIKNDNRRANLQVLCKDCHRKQPQHQHIYMKAGEMALILRLRRCQQLIGRTWESAYKHADLAVRPLLEVAQRRGWEAPEVGLELDSEAQFDAAWPGRRLGVSSTIGSREVPGWVVEPPGKLLRDLAAEL